MRKTKIKQGCCCPKCGNIEKQKMNGLNRSGTHKCFCKCCGANYTLNPKVRAYPAAVRKLAIKEFYAGISGRGVGKIHGFSKANVYNWLKKSKHTADKSKHKI